ncbi:MAG TPA: hypothetical protein VGP21_07025 [Opitutaceae bacterium]|jgi:hypothetical protein|nr:hypothetical protein [Opitutaceae bacterium]
MKPSLIVMALLFASLWAAAPAAAQAQAPAAGDAYQKFIDQMVTPENVADCIAKMDGIIDQGEQLAETYKDSPHGLNAETNIGVHLSLCVFSGKEAVLYYLTLSRGGQEFHPSDATKLAALFCDRAGFPHPTPITAGEKPVYYVQWNIKHSDWRAMKKMMDQVRAENRSEKDPRKAFVTAIMREIDARDAGSVGGP